jgi:zinc transporter ZupT
VAARVIATRTNVRFEELAQADARKALLIVGVMTVHSVAEGIGVGVSFADTQSLGLATALAIAVHNIPEGLAISLVLVPRGVRVLHAAGWSIVSSMPQPLLAVPAFAFVAAFSGLLPVGLGFAAGAMLWMVAAELIPDALRAAPVGRVVVSSVIATAALVALQALLLTA